MIFIGAGLPRRVGPRTLLYAWTTECQAAYRRRTERKIADVLQDQNWPLAILNTPGSGNLGVGQFEAQWRPWPIVL